MGINKLDPKQPEHVSEVHSLRVPPELIDATTCTYRYLFWRLTDKTIEQYLQEEMGVDVPVKKKKVTVVFGSESDIPRVEEVLQTFKPRGQRVHLFEDLTMHVVSCHRNPSELMKFAQAGCHGADVVVTVGGKAFAMPGVLDAWLHHFGYLIPVVGVALGKEGSESLKAAQLSISELPGEYVVMDEINDVVYTGREGFLRSLERIAHGELPPPKERGSKAPHWQLPIGKFYPEQSG